MNTKLNYDPNTGVFTWAISSARRIQVGARAGCLDKAGYIQIRIDGKIHRAHRLAWFFVHGVYPADQIDHINGVRDDNRISNLRIATHGENQQNRGKQKNNTSGYLGVSWHKHRGKFSAQIQVNGKQKNLGYFDDPDEAHQAYVTAKADLHQFNPIPR
jgi:hypothetical protein